MDAYVLPPWMTGAAGTLFKRLMHDRMEHALHRTAVGAVTAHARFRPGGDLMVRRAERIGSDVVTLAAEFTARLDQHPLQVGAMGFMALQTVLGGGLMIHPVYPEFGDRGMAAQAQLGLVLLEDVFIRRTVRRMTGGALPFGQRLMLHGSTLMGAADGLMALEAKVILGPAQNFVIVGRMRRMTFAALPLHHRRMADEIPAPLPALLMTILAEFAVLVLVGQIPGYFGPVQQVAGAAITLGKRPVLAEPAPLGCRCLVTGKTEIPLAFALE